MKNYFNIYPIVKKTKKIFTIGANVVVVVVVVVVVGCVHFSKTIKVFEKNAVIHVTREQKKKIKKE